MTLDSFYLNQTSACWTDGQWLGATEWQLAQIAQCVSSLRLTRCTQHVNDAADYPGCMPRCESFQICDFHCRILLARSLPNGFMDGLELVWRKNFTQMVLGIGPVDTTQGHPLMNRFSRSSHCSNSPYG